MVRTHTLVEFRRKQHELEIALRSLEKQQDGEDYKLDVEFYHRLEALAKEHGYSFTQVFDLLQSRYESTSETTRHGSNGNKGVETLDSPLCLKSRTNTGLLDLIERLQPSDGKGAPSLAGESVFDTDAMLTVGLPSGSVGKSPELAPIVAGDVDESTCEEKSND